MLIEFSCPVCQAALAIKKQTTGGQVNCPKCQKLILLPSESPLPRENPDAPPFQKGRQVPVSQVAKSICVSVEPYRRDLETKTNLLNDAVEMVKIRNERIKEIESLMLNTQSELWALEVELDDLRSQGGQDAQKLTERNQQLEEKKDLLKARLSNMVSHAKEMDEGLKAYQELFHDQGIVSAELDRIREIMSHQESHLQESGQILEEARTYLENTRGRLIQCHTDKNEREQKRQEMEELVRASSEDMQRALDERNQWRKQAQELEKRSEKWVKERELLEVKLSEAEHIQQDWQQDRESAQTLRNELEENLALLRNRIEEEREAHRKILQEREETLKTGSEKKIRALEKKLKVAASELEAAEAKQREALKTQQHLAEQNLKADEERSQLKRQLQEAMERLEQLEHQGD